VTDLMVVVMMLLDERICGSTTPAKTGAVCLCLSVPRNTAYFMVDPLDRPLHSLNSVRFCESGAENKSSSFDRLGCCRKGGVLQSQSTDRQDDCCHGMSCPVSVSTLSSPDPDPCTGLVTHPQHLHHDVVSTEYNVGLFVTSTAAGEEKHCGCNKYTRH
jgi:hypothetical protein